MIRLSLTKGHFFLPATLLTGHKLTVKLFWEGIWEINPEKINVNQSPVEGVYMILSGKKAIDNKGFDPETYKVLYIGESRNIFESLSNPKQWVTWKKIAGKDNLLLKLAKTETGINRKKLAADLAYYTRPLCNKEGILSFSNPTHEIQNLGYKSPLSRSYHPLS